MNSPNKCPKCGSPNISWTDDIDYQTDEISQLVECEDCGVKWWEVFIFSHIEYFKEK
jgi:DNA-directed RNA polymerase subunit M/transcription elongation factor TFIIS